MRAGRPLARSQAAPFENAPLSRSGSVLMCVTGGIGEQWGVLSGRGWDISAGRSADRAGALVHLWLCRLPVGCVTLLLRRLLTPAQVLQDWFSAERRAVGRRHVWSKR